MYATYLIPTANLPTLIKRLERIAKAAAKLDQDFLYAQMRTLTQPHPEDRRRLLELTAVTIRAETPRLAGWAFVGALQHAEGAVILRAAPSETIPARYRTASPDHCDHCQKLRRRKDTYIIQHCETGEYKQVGKSCLRDFLGHANPHRVAAHLTSLIDLDQEICEASTGYASDDYLPTLTAYLAQAAACIDADGWVSRARSREMADLGTFVEATADWAWHHFVGCSDRTCRDRHLHPSEQNHQEAKAAAEWAGALQPSSSDYLWNVLQVAEIGYVDARTAGIAASIITAYRREQRRAAKAVAQGTSEHFGKIKERSVWTLTLTYRTSWQGPYGTTYLYRFRDQDGNVAVWFATRSQDLDCHKTYGVKGTIKDHSVRDGVKQTVLTRCSVIAQIAV